MVKGVSLTINVSHSEMSLRKEVRLSSSGMQRVCEHDHAKFRFYVGAREYECGIFEACFLSGRVSRLLLSDCTADSLYLDISDDGNVFDDFLKLGCGGSLVLDEDNIEVVKRICLCLDNVELYSEIVDFSIGSEAISKENVISRLCTKQAHCLDSSDEISFIGSHFYEFDISSLGHVCVNDLECILCSDDLKLKDENSLVDLIVSLCDEMGGDEYYSLFRYVYLEYVDISHLNTYLSRVYPEHIDEGIWSCLCRCLRCQHDSKGLPLSPSGKRFVGEEYVFTEGSPFAGIISHLREECGGNVHQQGIVNITESSHNYNECYQVTDYDWRDFWGTDDRPNSWICFDFKEKRVKLTGYSLKSDTREPNWHHLVQWVIEGSNDESSWHEIDRRNTQDLKGPSVVKTYSCGGEISEGFRFIRLRQTGKNSYGYDYLFLAAIEFFGTLFRN